MAYAAWKEGTAAREASFALLFRRNPFDGGFTIAAGLEHAVDLVAGWRYGEEDLSFLAAQRGGDGAPLFDPGFLEALRALELDVDVDAVPEGTVVFPQEPLVRVSGPVVPCMLLESALLAIVNFQSLVATKAARVCLAARRRRPSSSSGCGAPRGSTAGSPPPAPRTSAAATRPRTRSPAGSSGSR